MTHWSNAIALFLAITVIAAEQCAEKVTWSIVDGQLMVNGEALVLKGVNYHGFQTKNFAPLGLMEQNLDDILDVIKNNNFNAIQVPFSMELVRDNPNATNIACGKNPGLCGSTAIRMLDILIHRAAEKGLLVSLSNNQLAAANSIYPPSQWYDSEYTEEKVIRLWNVLTTRYRNQWNVFAIDLKDEPSYKGATWGNSNRSTDWNKAAERMIKSLGTFNGFYFVDGIDFGTDLANARDFPIDSGSAILNSRVVYSPHCYGPEIFKLKLFNISGNYPEYLGEEYMRQYGFLSKNGLPVVIGEWGASHDPDSPGEKWNKWYVEWLRSKCLTNNFYWSLDPDSSYTSGLLQSDWKTPVTRKLELVNRTQPNPTKFSKARNGNICITKGAFPEKHCNRSK